MRASGWAWVVVSVLGWVTGCGGQQASSAAPAVSLPSGAALAASPTAPAPAVDYVWDRERFPPAYDLHRGQQILKGDAYDDQRWAAPQLYAITEPPQGIEGFRGMTEWEPMTSVVMSYPQGFIAGADNATQTMVQVGKHASTVAEVWYLVTSKKSQDHLTEGLVQAGVDPALIGTKIRFHTTAFDTVWFIDFGPLPIVDPVAKTFSFADFRYYHERVKDDGVPTALGRDLPVLGQAGPVATYRMPIYTEGGTYQTTSDGICFTGTRQIFHMSCDAGKCDDTTGGRASFENAKDGFARPKLSEIQKHKYAEEMRQIWEPYAGCKDVVITHSVTDDGTGHIDMYLKVVDDQTVLIGKYVAPFEANTRQAENAALLDETAAFLEAYVKPDGTTFKVERLVMPGHRTVGTGADTEYIPFTYINSTFINGLNLWPATLYPEWEASRIDAETTWKTVMPTYEHIWIDSTELSFWSGAIHCVTRTIPALPPATWVSDGACPTACEGVLCNAADGGYAGECLPHGIEEAVCWGPAWECDCNDCLSGCGAPNPAACLEEECQCIGYEGCCAGKQLKYCDGGALAVQSCTNGCGWAEDQGWYDCAGGTGTAVANQADPSGQFPLDCAAVATPCVAQCDGKTCGDDGCGGSCGTCAAGEACSDLGQCGPPCVNTCEAAGSGCDGSTAWACSEGPCGCMDLTEVDCAKTGQACDAGVCVGDPVLPADGAGTPDAATAEGGPGTPDAGTGTPDGSTGTPDGGPTPDGQPAADAKPGTPDVTGAGADPGTAADSGVAPPGVGQPARASCSGGPGSGSAARCAWIGLALLVVWARRRQALLR